MEFDMENNSYWLSPSKSNNILKSELEWSSKAKKWEYVGVTINNKLA